MSNSTTTEPEIFTVGLLIGALLLAVLDGATPDTDEEILWAERQKAIAQCEKDLPRSQKCSLPDLVATPDGVGNAQVP